MAGLDATGFTAQTFQETRDLIDARLRSEFGQSIDLSDESVLGRIVAILAEQITTLWELGEAIHSSGDPDKATDAALDAICAITGTLRRAAFPSEVVLTLTGTPSTVVLTGSRAVTASTGVLFETTEDVTITLVASWVGSTAYVVGDRVTNSGDVYQCVVAGTSAVSGGPSGEGTGIVDGTAQWDFLGDGTGAVDAEAESADDGPVVATSRDLTVIDTPVAGWESVINVLDADVGSLIETNEALRIRRELELSSGGLATLRAIRAGLLDVDGVTAASVFQNVTDVTDADGLPPHSVEALVQGGDDQDLFDRLLEVVAAGIQTHGTETGSAVDDQGTSHVMKFSRPTEIEIYVDVTLIKDPGEYPVDGDDQVELAIVNYGDAQSTGKDVVASALIAQCFTVPGVLDVTAMLIDTSPSPATSTTISIDLRELAIYDTSRIDVSSSDGVP